MNALLLQVHTHPNRNLNLNQSLNLIYNLKKMLIIKTDKCEILYHGPYFNAKYR